MKYIDFLFVDGLTGEEFLVEVQDTQYAQKYAFEIAHENFQMPKLICQMSSEQAEWLGIDTY